MRVEISAPSICMVAASPRTNRPDRSGQQSKPCHERDQLVLAACLCLREHLSQMAAGCSHADLLGLRNLRERAAARQLNRELRLRRCHVEDLLHDRWLQPRRLVQIDEYDE